MGFLERLTDLARAVFTIESEFRHLSQSQDDLEEQVRDLSRELGDLRERLVRLETARDADRAQMAAEVARFRAEVERAEIRLARAAPPASLPEPGSDQNSV